MHKKLFLCLLLLCSFIFIASASDPPSYELQPRDASDDQDDFMLAAEPLIDDDENTLIDDDEEDEEATSSLNHIDEDDAKDNVEEIDIWANAGDIDDDEPEESEEDLVDDEDEDAEDDEHDHEDDEDDDEEDDEEDDAIDHDSFDEPDEDPFEQDRVQFGLDPDTTQTEEEEELKWSNQFIPEEDRSPEQIPPTPQQQPTYNDDEKELEQGHADAELETKEQESSLMDLGVEDDADNDIPPPEHGSHHNSELEKENTLVQDWDVSLDPATKEPCHKRSTLVWLGLLACCLVLFYGARIRAKSDGLDGDGKHAILPLHQNDIKSPLASSPLSDPSMANDAHSTHLHPPLGRGHHRKASSLSAHITPRSRPTSVGHESPWTGEWKEGKEW